MSRAYYAITIPVDGSSYIEVPHGEAESLAHFALKQSDEPGSVDFRFEPGKDDRVFLKNFKEEFRKSIDATVTAWRRSR